VVKSVSKLSFVYLCALSFHLCGPHPVTRCLRGREEMEKIEGRERGKRERGRRNK
jgi:hypothetical protein